MDSEQLLSNLKHLSQMAWDNECELPVVRTWLDQFTGRTKWSADEEQHEMLYLLTNFIYFGMNEVRGLLRALYQQVFRYRLIEAIRARHNDTTDRNLINRELAEELHRTRFVPIGNPSESSSHLLYYFRQENSLPKSMFVNAIDLFDEQRNRLKPPDLRRCVIIDDFAGSGQQADRLGRRLVTRLRKSGTQEVCYYVLVATKRALDKLRAAKDKGPQGVGLFDDVACVYELGDEFQAFSEPSLFYDRDDRKSMARRIARTYGATLRPNDPLGFRNGQLMIGFRHNVPNNTLPIFSAPVDGTGWESPFPRYPKV